MSYRLTELFTSLIMGEGLPAAWPEHERVSAGEELRNLVRDAAPQADQDREELKRIERILTDFGALAVGDRTTGLADLLECLLPPAVDNG